VDQNNFGNLLHYETENDIRVDTSGYRLCDPTYYALPPRLSGIALLLNFSQKHLRLIVVVGMFWLPDL
jgi:hypothetical protein